MAWERSTNQNKVVARIKKETEKAYLIIAKDIKGCKEFREFWVPKSQVLSEKENKKDENLADLGLSDWIYDKLEPCSDFEFQDYDGIPKPPKGSAPKVGARNYVMKPRPTKAEEEDGYLTPDEEDIPF